MTKATSEHRRVAAVGVLAPAPRTFRIALVIILAVCTVAIAGVASAALDRDLPPSPRSVQASHGETGTVATVGWAPASPKSGVVGFRVWRAEGGGEFVPVGSVSAVATSFADRAGAPGTAYRYRVTAVDADGLESVPSAQSATITAEWSLSPHIGRRLGNPGAPTCRLCHVSHSAEASVALLRADGVRVGQLGVCYRCHDGTGADADIAAGTSDSFGLASGHSLEALPEGGDVTNACGDCHHLHGDSASQPGLLARAVRHSSLGTRPVAGSVSLCLACHDDEDSWFVGENGPYPSRAQAPKDGLGYPLFGTFPGPAVYTDPAKNPHASNPAVKGSGREKGDCLFCHAAHRGPNRYDGLRALYRPSSAETLEADRVSGAYAALCFMCHGGSRPSFLATLPTDIRRFAVWGGKNAGHRVQAAGAAIPAGAALPCYECHNPHGSASGYALEVVAATAPGEATLVGDADGEIVMGPRATPVDVRRFCLTCHTTADSASGWDGRSMRPVKAGAKVIGIDRTGPGAVLRLPDLKAHRDAETRSCYACHGSDYSAANSFNVHNPTFGKPPGEAQCDVCHDGAPSGAGTGSGEASASAEASGS